MHSLTEWTASIPEQVNARVGLRFIDEALADAKEATNAIIAEYQGGTLPPPPWPQPPELVQAINALEGGKNMLNIAITLGRGDDMEPRTGPHASRIIEGGRRLYTAIDKMRSENIKGRTTSAEMSAKAAAKAAELAAKAAAGVGKALLPTGIGGLLVIGGLLYLMSKDDDD